MVTTASSHVANRPRAPRSRPKRLEPRRPSSKAVLFHARCLSSRELAPKAEAPAQRGQKETPEKR